MVGGGDGTGGTGVPGQPARLRRLPGAGRLPVARGRQSSRAARRRQLYAGTDRAARGHVLHALRRLPAGERASGDDLIADWPDVTQARRALASLVADGLVRAGSGGYRL